MNSGFNKALTSTNWTFCLSQSRKTSHHVFKYGTFKK